MPSKATWKYAIRDVEIDGDVCRIPLKDGRTALVDAADAPLVVGNNWSSSGGCVVSGLGRLHHIILPPRDGLLPDHKNGDILDNRRSNLRLATNAQNCQNRRRAANNRSGFKGVCYRKDRKTWLAYIRVDDVLTKLGTFATAEDAARAYDAAARSTYGEFAALNFPRPGERQA